MDVDPPAPPVLAASLSNTPSHPLPSASSGAPSLHSLLGIPKPKLVDANIDLDEMLLMDLIDDAPMKPLAVKKQTFEVPKHTPKPPASAPPSSNMPNLPRPPGSQPAAKTLPNHHSSHSDGDGKDAFECPECHKGFAKKSALDRHSLVHAEVKPYKCDKCEKSFMRGDSLAEHKNSAHGEGSRPFQCDKCPRDFVSAKRLREHKRSHERPHACSKCARTFSQRHHLVQHELTHDESRQFECPECHVHFAKERMLKSHMTAHSEDRPHECDVCHKRFKDKRHLKDHHYLHEEPSKWRCNRCEQVFQTRSRLGHHKCPMVAETEMVVCTQPGCDKKFDKQTKLNRHLRMVHQIAVEKKKRDRSAKTEGGEEEDSVSSSDLSSSSSLSDLSLSSLISEGSDDESDKASKPSEEKKD